MFYRFLIASLNVTHLNVTHMVGLYRNSEYQQNYSCMHGSIDETEQEFDTFAAMMFVAKYVLVM